MMIEGSGSGSRAGTGSIPLTSASGSGSGRQKKHVDPDLADPEHWYETIYIAMFRFECGYGWYWYGNANNTKQLLFGSV
jgi:hypothetical protein